MLILVVAACSEEDPDVVFVGEETEGRLVVETRSGGHHNYLVIGPDGRFLPVTRQVVMAVDRAGRGIYYSVERIIGYGEQAKLRQIGFEEVIQSHRMINRLREFQLIAGAQSGR